MNPMDIGFVGLGIHLPAVGNTFLGRKRTCDDEHCTFHSEHDTS